MLKVVTLLQREEFPWEEGRVKLTTAEEVFADEDRKKQMVLGNWLLIIKVPDTCLLNIEINII